MLISLATIFVNYVLYKSCWLKAEDNVSLNFSKHNSYEWSRLSIGYQMTRYCILIHTFLSHCYSIWIVIWRHIANFARCQLNISEHPKLSYIPNARMHILEAVGNFQQSITYGYIHVDSLVYTWFETLQIPFFIHKTTYGSCIEVTILVHGRCQAISSWIKVSNTVVSIVPTIYFISADIAQSEYVMDDSDIPDLRTSDTNKWWVNE